MLFSCGFMESWKSHCWNQFTQIAIPLQNWYYKYSWHLTQCKLGNDHTLNFILLCVNLCLCTESIMFKMLPVYAQTFVAPSVCSTFSQAKWVMKPKATNFLFHPFSYACTAPQNHSFLFKFCFWLFFLHQFHFFCFRKSHSLPLTPMTYQKYLFLMTKCIHISAYK